MLMFTINTLRKNHAVDPFVIPRCIVPETNIKIYLVQTVYHENVINCTIVLIIIKVKLI